MPLFLLSALNRLVLAAVTLFGVAVVVFVLLRVVPGDPIAMMISPGSTPEQIAQMRANYGLDGSILSQFWIWLKAILVGDFGTSISLRRNVLELLGERLPATLMPVAATSSSPARASRTAPSPNCRKTCRSSNPLSPPTSPQPWRPSRHSSPRCGHRDRRRAWSALAALPACAACRAAAFGMYSRPSAAFITRA